MIESCINIDALGKTVVVYKVKPLKRYHIHVYTSSHVYNNVPDNFTFVTFVATFRAAKNFFRPMSVTNSHRSATQTHTQSHKHVAHVPNSSARHILSNITVVRLVFVSRMFVKSSMNSSLSSSQHNKTIIN